MFKIDNKIKAIVNNSMWLLLDKFARLFIGLAVGAWVARYLGPTEFGFLAYCISLVAFFQTFSLLGLDAIVVRELSKEKSESGLIIGTTVGLRILTSILSIISIFIFSLYQMKFDNQLAWMLVIVSFIILFQAGDTFDLWFQSQSQSKRTVKVKLVSYVISNSLRVLFVLMNKGVIFFACVLVVEYAVSAILLSWVFLRKKDVLNFRFNFSKAKELLTESWPYIISGLSIILYMRLDQIFIAHYLGAHQLGIYAAALPLSTAWNFVPMVLSISLAPYVAKAKDKNPVEYNKLIYNIMRLFFLLGFIISLFTYLFSALAVNILYGAAYKDTISILAIHGVTNLFICIGVAQSIWIVNERRSKIALAKTLLGAIICIVGNLIAIPIWGISGVAIVAVLSQCVSAFLSNLILAPKVFRMQMRSILLLGYKNE